MKGITVSLDDETAVWAELYAARRNMSLSRLLSELLHKTMRESQAHELAMQRYLERRPRKLKAADADYPTRDDVNERPGFR